MRSVPSRGSGWVSGAIWDLGNMKSVPPRGSGWVSLAPHARRSVSLFVSPKSRSPLTSLAPTSIITTSQNYYVERHRYSACFLHIFPHLWHVVARRLTRVY